MFRFFISLIFLSLFWPSLIFPRHAISPTLARRRRHHAISCPAIYHFPHVFSKTQIACQEKKRKNRTALSSRASGVRDYSLIESPSQIKRASRDVPLIN